MAKYKPKEHKDYPGYYTTGIFPEVAANRQGEIVRLVDARDTNNQIEGKAFGKVGDKSKGSLNKNGYRFIRTDNKERGRRTKTYCHRITCCALLGPEPKGQPYVNHKDKVRDNNNITNLEWSSVSANTTHGLRTKVSTEMRGIQEDILSRTFNW